MQQRHPVVPQPAALVQQRRALFAMLQPVALTNCQLARFGEAHDGGYLMCGNLLGGVQSGYSYGIGGYDKWGCDISATLDVAVHQYDCFNTSRPRCWRGETIFHEECVRFHWVQDERHLRVVRRLKQFFEVGHIHFNNASCIGGLQPFPSSAYEVLFVSKRLALVDPSRKAGGVHPLDAPNSPWAAGCQPKAG